MRLKLHMPIATVFAVAALAGTFLAPATANAQSRRQEAEHRKNVQNEWRNLTIGSAAAAIVGVVTHNKTLTAVGAAGALYSGYRLSQDGKNDRNRDRYYNQYDRNRNDDYYRNDQYGRYDQYGNFDQRSGYRDPHANPDGRMIARYGNSGYYQNSYDRDGCDNNKHGNNKYKNKNKNKRH